MEIDSEGFVFRVMFLAFRVIRFFGCVLRFFSVFSFSAFFIELSFREFRSFIRDTEFIFFIFIKRSVFVFLGGEVSFFCKFLIILDVLRSFFFESVIFGVFFIIWNKVDLKGGFVVTFS